MNSPPQHLPYLPRLEEIVPLTEIHIAQRRELIQNILQSVRPLNASFQNVVLPIAQLQNEQQGLRQVIGTLKHCSPSIEIQQAAEKSEDLWQEYKSDLKPALFTLLRSVREKCKGELDDESQKLVDYMLLQFEELGYGTLEEANITKCFKTEKKITDICTKIISNLKKPNEGIWFTSDELDGVPKQDRGSPGPDGRELINTSEAYFAVMKYAHNSETRSRMLINHGTWRSESAPLFKELLLLRNQLAKERGFPNHAATKIPYRLAESIDWINELLDTLAKALVPVSRAEYEMLQDKKFQHMKSQDIAYDSANSELMAWDVLYYRKMVEYDGQVDHIAIAEYFPLGYTMNAMLDLIADCLQIRFDPIPTERLKDFVWDQHVEGWTVWDKRSEANETFIGYFFTDLLERPNKLKNCMSHNMQPGYIRSDGTRIYPANVLLANCQAPSSTTGVLLKHGDVIMLFHELGHSIHDLLARTTYAQFHGCNAVDEFVEGIAIMLENWCWIKDEVKALSCHYTRIDLKYKDAWQQEHPGRDLPPEKIPDKLLDGRFKRRHISKLQSVLGNMTYALFDMAVHTPSSQEALENAEEIKIYNDIFERLRFRRLPEPTYRYLAGIHLMAGYDAGYYSYVCAEVLAADLFQTAFAENPRNREAWDKFRCDILKYGGSRNELHIIENFLGNRPFSLKPLLAIMGLGVQGRSNARRTASAVDDIELHKPETVRPRAQRICQYFSRQRLCLTFNLALLVMTLISLGFLEGKFSRVEDIVTEFHFKSSQKNSYKDSIGLRTRREWRNLTESEKTEYINAVNCLSSMPAKSRPAGSLYDDFTYIYGLVGQHYRNATSFLPWNRLFLHAYETELRSSCGYNSNLVYWDWSLDWQSLEKSAVFSTRKGFGGNGNSIVETDREKWNCVTEGPFSALRPVYQFQYPDSISPRVHCLNRNFTTSNTRGQISVKAIEPVALQEILLMDDYESFCVKLMNGPGQQIPAAIGGDFGDSSGSNDPLFFLHLSQLDRLWWIWQQQQPSDKLIEYKDIANSVSVGYPRLGDTLSLGGQLAPSVKVLDVLNTESELLNYAY